MIFLTATACPVSWSLAELYSKHQRPRLQKLPCHGSPDKTESSHTDRLQVGVPVQLLEIRDVRRAWCKAYLLVISKVVPKIWARTNSAILTAG